MLRILTVTLNPALDELYEIPNFAVGALNKPTRKTVTVGGKGINVARAYRALGGDATAIAVVGGRIGRDIIAGVEQEGIPATFINVAAESRLCVKITDPVGGSQTEINEAGPGVSQREYDEIVARVREQIAGFDVIILSGSIPPGVPTDIYARLIRIAQDEYGVRAVLDAAGDALLAGLLAKPWLAKPNREEARAVGINSDPWQSAASELRSAYGAEVGLVTAGAAGAALATPSGVWEARPPKIDVKSAVGSGDSLTAGFLMGWGETSDPAQALAQGVATGAANASRYGSAEIAPADVEALIEQVQVTRTATL